MKLKQYKFIVSMLSGTAILLFFTIACSQQAGYEALKKQHEIRCNRVQESDYEACVEETKKQYDDYKQQRDDIVKQ